MDTGTILVLVFTGTVIIIIITFIGEVTRYFLDEFKKSKPLSIDGDLKKSEDAKAWLLGMNKFFELHDYTENMMARIVILIFKWKANIWWEDVKWVRDIRTKELSWHEFKILFKKKYLSERY